jgi:hypothetical protein
VGVWDSIAGGTYNLVVKLEDGSEIDSQAVNVPEDQYVEIIYTDNDLP